MSDYPPATSRRSGLALRLLALFLALLASTAAGASAGASEDLAWRMPFRDPQRSNFSKGTGHLATPALRWRAPMDGAAAAVAPIDVDADGFEDLLLVGGGRVVARRFNGAVLWATPVLGVTFVVRAADMTGDGIPDVVAIGPRSVYLISTQNGQVLWQSQAGLLKSLSGFWISDFSGDGTADLAFADAGSPIGVSTPKSYLFSFKGGTPTQFATTAIPLESGQFANGLAQHALDVDGDDVADLLIAEQALGALSGKTGALLGTSEVGPKLSPWPVTVATVPAGPGQAPFVVWAGDSGGMPGHQQQVGWRVYQLQGNALKVLWAFDSPAAVDESVRLAPATVGDLDGDGQPELLASHFAEGAWRLEAFDLATGKPLPALAQTPLPGTPGPLLRGAYVDGAKTILVYNLLASRVDEPMAPLRLATWSRKAGVQPLADLGTGAWWAANRPESQSADTHWRTPRQPLVSLSTGQSAPEVLVQRDLDGDLRVDALERVVVGATGQLVTAGTLKLPTGSRLLELIRGGGLQVATVAGDGRVSLWSAQATLTNDADGNGLGDLQQRIGGPVQLSVAARSPGGLPILAATSGAQVLVLDPAGAGPAKPPAQLWTDSPAPQNLRANLADTDGDGNVEVVVRSRPAVGNAVVRGHGLNGDVKWSWTWPGAPRYWDLALDSFWAADLDGDGAEELYLQAGKVNPSSSPDQLSLVLHGKTHVPQWDPSAGCSQYSGIHSSLDTSVSPPRSVYAPYYSRHSCNALNGTLLQKKDGTNGAYGVPMLADLDQQPPLDVLMGGPNVELEAHSGADFASLWHVADNRAAGQAAAIARVGQQQVYVQAVGANAEVNVRDPSDGKLLWAQVYLQGKAWPVDQAPKHNHTIAGLTTVADLTGKGQAAALFTSSEGLLYAVALQDGAVLWTYDMGGVAGAPVPADVDGDGLLEILVPSPNGELLALDSGVAVAPEWVREHGPQGPALTDAADLDTQEDAEALAVNWATVPGAAGYVLRLIDDAGGEVVAATPASTTQADLKGLYLQPGRTYFAVVASHASQGADASFSTETKSDGIQVVDASPPWVEGLHCEPACSLPQGTTITIAGLVRDRTRLQSVAAERTAAGEVPQKQQWPWLSATYSLKWPLANLAVGSHQVTISAVDLAGHATAATLTLTICAPKGTAGSPQCKDTTSSQGEDVNVYGTRAEGCGAHGTASEGWALALLGLLAAWGWRRRPIR